MGHFQILVTIAFTASFAVGNKGDAPGLEAMIEALKSDIVKLQDEANLELVSEISGLKSEIRGLKMELQSPDAPPTFDCYLSNDWSTDGIIRFDGCVADTTTVGIGYCDYHLVTNIGYCDYLPALIWFSDRINLRGHTK